MTPLGAIGPRSARPRMCSGDDCLLRILAVFDFPSPSTRSPSAHMPAMTVAKTVAAGMATHAGMFQ